MAHSKSTSNYGLSQFAGTDKPAWLVDYNADMLAIDTNLKTASDSASAATTAITAIQSELDTTTVTANNAESKSTAAQSNIAKAYDATSTYSIDDKVLYNNLLYRCITPISAAESFDGKKWERITIDGIVDTLNDGLSQLNSRLTINNIKTISLTTNKYESIDTSNSFTPSKAGIYRIVLNYHNDEPLELRVGTSSDYRASQYIVNQPEGNLGTLNLICFLDAGVTYSIGTKYANGGIVDTNAGYIQRIITIN